MAEALPVFSEDGKLQGNLTSSQGEPPASPDIASLATPADKSSIADLVKAQERKTLADAAITGKADRQLDIDQQRLEQAYKAEGVAAGEQLKPWDADKEHKKFETDPVEGFGSIGGLFAMVASAFTKAPMENAILGMAGALNGLKEGNEAGYTRAHESWKDNTKLALERFKTQHELYQDALGLMDHDAGAANAKLHNAAVRFGDDQTLFLAEHGMVKELFELQASRASAAEQIRQTLDNATDAMLRRKAFDSGVAALPQTGNPQVDAAHQLNLWQKTHGGDSKSPQQALMGQWFLEHPEGTAEEAAKFADSHGIIRQYGGAGGASNIPGRVETGMIVKRAEELRKEDPSLSETEAYTIAKRDIAVESRPPSPNKIDELRGKIDQTDNIITGAQKNLDFLHQFKGGAGLMGKIMRGEEIASNIVGAGTQSERVEFRRRVHELQEMVPRIIVDANGRPLKSAQDKVDDFVAGLNSGDTGPNTIRAYEELIAEMRKRQKDYRGRIEGGYEAGSKSSGAAAGASPQAPANTDWLSAYPEKK
jgi:hypothetical protein